MIVIRGGFSNANWPHMVTSLCARVPCKLFGILWRTYSSDQTQLCLCVFMLPKIVRWFICRLQKGLFLTYLIIVASLWVSTDQFVGTMQWWGHYAKLTANSVQALHAEIVYGDLHTQLVSAGCNPFQLFTTDGILRTLTTGLSWTKNDNFDFY